MTPSNNRRLLVTGTLISPWLGIAGPGSARADDAKFPSRPVRLVVPFATGTGSDLLARLLAKGLSTELGGAVIVENRPGGGGVVGTEYVATSPPDGHTLTVGSSGTLVASPLMVSTPRYRTEEDFRGVLSLARSGFVIGVANTADAPTTLPELVERIRRGGHTYAVSGVGTMVHLTAIRFLKAVGGNASHVAYPGSSAALTDVAAGHVQFSMETHAATMPMVNTGRLRPLAVTSEARNPSLPDVPTVAESGFPGFSVYTWFGLVAPSKTPPAILATLERAARKAMSADEPQERLRALGLDPMALGLQDFDRFIAGEIPGWREVVKGSGIKLS